MGKRDYTRVNAKAGSLHRTAQLQLKVELGLVANLIVEIKENALMESVFAMSGLWERIVVWLAVLAGVMEEEIASKRLRGLYLTYANVTTEQKRHFA